MNTAFMAHTPTNFADYVMDELGRWISIDCPIAFKSRKFKTTMFEFLTKDNDSKSPLNINFTANGYVVIKMTMSSQDEYMNLVARFLMADPKLRDNLVECFNKLNSEDTSDFILVSEARLKWKRCLL